MRKLHTILAIGVLTFATFDAMTQITLISDPNVLAIPILDNKESWVDVTQQKVILYGPSPEIPNNKDYTFLRKTVYEKLVQAQNKLPKGLHFCLYEGYRSLSLQKMLFDKQFSNIKARHPQWSKEQIFLETTKLVSPVKNLDNSANIPPHSTGAAVDVYLCDTKGKAVDMGIHPKDWTQDIDGSLSLTASKHISKTARKNRDIMSEVLHSVGFVNYPTEYWHWSYGDRYWAYLKQESHAIYGSY